MSTTTHLVELASPVDESFNHAFYLDVPNSDIWGAETYITQHVLSECMCIEIYVHENRVLHLVFRCHLDYDFNYQVNIPLGGLALPDWYEMTDTEQCYAAQSLATDVLLADYLTIFSGVIS